MTEESQRYARLASFLLVVSAVSIAVSIVLAAWFFYQRGSNAELRASLLSQTELQAQLLSQRPQDWALSPHKVSEIGYVLDPALKRSTFRSAKDADYRVNSLGLRGPEIGQKAADTKRILLVGDSVVFGWKLGDDDRLSGVLNAYRERIATPVEFVTVALPGWNVRSERAFLEAHLRLLDPDVIIWWSISNDVEDTPGVIPPGYLTMWASPQAKNNTPIAGLSATQKHKGSFIPFVAEQRQKNAAMISSFGEKYNIPVVWMGRPVHDSAGDLPAIDLTPEYRSNPAHILSKADSHPSPWATRYLAVGILRKLALLGTIPEVEFSQSESDIAQHFARAEQLRLETPTQPESKIVGQMDEAIFAQIPTSFSSESQVKRPESILYGLGPKGQMDQAGALLLRGPSDATQLLFSMMPPPNMPRYPGRADFSVRNRSGDVVETRAVVDSTNVEVKLALPENLGSPEGETLYQISWVLDYTLCNGPSLCSSGTLQKAEFEPNTVAR